jgi:hypothetical protein
MYHGQGRRGVIGGEITADYSTAWNYSGAPDSGSVDMNPGLAPDAADLIGLGVKGGCYQGRRFACFEPLPDQLELAGLERDWRHRRSGNQWDERIPEVD